MIVPHLKDSALLDDIQGAQCPDDGVTFWWIGQSGYLFKHRDRYLMIDPYLSDSLTEKYAKTDKPHVRMTEQCLDPNSLGFVDVVLSTHGHTDHFDVRTLKAIACASNRAQPLTLVVPASQMERARREFSEIEVKLVAMDAGESLSMEPFELSAVPAAHTRMERDKSGNYLYLGYVMDFGETTIYHSGDTIWNNDILPYLEPRTLHVALLPINGNDPAKGVAGNFDGAEAAAWAERIGSKLVIPQHYDMFEFNTATPEKFVKTCKALKMDFRVLECGERWASNDATASI